MRRPGLLAVIVLALLAGCGDDGGSSESSSSETSTSAEAPTSTPTPIEDPGTLSAEAFDELNSTDDDLQAGVTGFQDSLTECVALGSADVSALQSCFSEKYRPYGRSLNQILVAIDTAQDEADGDCADALEGAEDAARELQRVSDRLNVEFQEGEYGGGGVEDFASGFNAYRDDMDEALEGCQP